MFGVGVEPQVGAQKDWALVYAPAAACGVFVMALIAGFAEGASANDGVRLLTAFGVPWSIALFCALDARAHQKVFVQSFWLITFFTWPIAPLFHLVRTRGKRGAVTYVVFAALQIFCFATSCAIGSLIKK
jgi:hypothetical protein